MSYIKSKETQQHIIEGGHILGEILDHLATMVEPGVSAWDIDVEAEKRIRAAGGVPAFKGYTTRPSDPPFPGTICASRNEEVVHGIPTKDKILVEGDLFSIDIGMQWPNGKDGFFTDTALTVPVGAVTDEAMELMRVTQKATEAGMAAVKIGGTIADIGRAIEDYVTSAGKYGIVRDLVGHGVGHAVHEDPRVPNFYDEDLEDWEIKPGVVIAIEPMLTLGTHEVDMAKDGWSIITRDKRLSAHFEHTIVVTDGGPVVATRRPSEK